MFTKRNSHLHLLVIALVSAVGMVFALTGNNTLAQGPDLGDIEARLDVLEKTVGTDLKTLREDIEKLDENLNWLYKLILVIPTLAAVMVVALEIRTGITERNQLQFMRDRENREAKAAKQREAREAKAAETINSVMSSVHQLLEFQAAQAKQIAERIEEFENLVKGFDPRQGIEAILNRVRELRREVKRSNLYDYHFEITDLANRMKNMEDFFDLPNFKRSIGCHYIRGLAAHLENRIEAANSHFNAVGRQISTDEGQKEADEYIEPMSLYFRGVLLKNLALFSEAKQCFEDVLEKWPKGKREIRTHIELAEVVALQNHYSVDDARTGPVFAVINQLIEEVNTGSGELTDRQASNLKAQHERLWLIEGNYAFYHEEWDKAIECYERGLEANPDGVFAILSIGITRSKMNQGEEARATLERAYNQIIANDRHMTHPEPRGRILLGGSAIIAARLGGLRDPIELQGDILREIETLRRINIRSVPNFHIFSPLTKQMHSLTDFKSHINRPLDFLR